MSHIYWGPNKVIVYQTVHNFSWQHNASERFTTTLNRQQKAAFIFNNKNIYYLCFIYYYYMKEMNSNKETDNN